MNKTLHTFQSSQKTALSPLLNNYAKGKFPVSLVYLSSLSLEQISLLTTAFIEDSREQTIEAEEILHSLSSNYQMKNLFQQWCFRYGLQCIEEKKIIDELSLGADFTHLEKQTTLFKSFPLSSLSQKNILEWRQEILRYWALNLHLSQTTNNHHKHHHILAYGCERIGLLGWNALLKTLEDLPTNANLSFLFQGQGQQQNVPSTIKSRSIQLNGQKICDYGLEKLLQDPVEKINLIQALTELTHKTSSELLAMNAESPAFMARQENWRLYAQEWRQALKEESTQGYRQCEYLLQLIHHQSQLSVVHSSSQEFLGLMHNLRKSL